jgi:tRNA (mo5U34)-methyltransferase
MVEVDEVRDRISKFPYWHYQFSLQGQLTPIVDARHVNRHRERRAYFLDPVVEALGGSLAGKRVLDLGCNAGYWSLAAIEAGADFVLGIDGRQTHVDQASFVFEASEINPERYAFRGGDVQRFDYNRYAPFDLVLCLGVLHHVRDPFGLLQRVAEVNSDLLLIDSTISRLPGAAFSLEYDDPSDPRKALDRQPVLVPTRRAVIEAVSSLGYTVKVLQPKFRDNTGLRDYRLGFRRAFVCSKGGTTNRVRAAEEKDGLATALQDLLAWGAATAFTGRKRRHAGARTSGRATRIAT